MIKNLLPFLLLSFSACASLDRTDPAPAPDASVDAPPDAKPTQSGCACDKDCPASETCEAGRCVRPECSCSDDCDDGDVCHYGKCYETCRCDADCSGPNNASCDHGLCKGH